MSTTPTDEEDCPVTTSTLIKTIVGLVIAAIVLVLIMYFLGKSRGRNQYIEEMTFGRVQQGLRQATQYVGQMR